jgi:hypothetical protein
MGAAGTSASAARSTYWPLLPAYLLAAITGRFVAWLLDRSGAAGQHMGRRRVDLVAERHEPAGELAGVILHGKGFLDEIFGDLTACLLDVLGRVAELVVCAE